MYSASIASTSKLVGLRGRVETTRRVEESITRMTRRAWDDSVTMVAQTHQQSGFLTLYIYIYFGKSQRTDAART